MMFIDPGSIGSAAMGASYRLMTTFFAPIVKGDMQSRVRDDFGSGQFGVSRDGGTRAHEGLDIVAEAGEQIFAPCDGRLIREAFPYKNDDRFRGILLRGSGKFADVEIKLFYVLGLFSGDVRAGDLIGHAQDLSIKYPTITNHVHMEVRRQGKVVSPDEYFGMCF